MEKPLLTLEEAAEFLGISAMKFREIVKAGSVPSVEVPGFRYPRFRKTDLEQWLADLQVKKVEK